MPDLSGAARELLLYTLWADRLFLNALIEVRPEDLVRDTGSSFPSILATMAHILGSQRVWLSRFAGAALERVPGAADFPDRESLAAAWADTSAELEFFLASLTDEQLRAEISWTTTRGEAHRRPLWQPVLHLVNHSSYHRGQVVTQLRQMGYPAPTSDLIYFLLEKSSAS
ncbi:MAG TPA: DinB family protein [Thermoanaerobaculia bacterium]|nr:DinB family protein [Thermoanaerobaculia bacterium]